MTTPNNVLNGARYWLNKPTREIPGGSNNVPGITDWYGVRGAWCAMFVSRVFYDAGLPLPASTAKGFAWCSSGADWFRKQGRAFSNAREAQPGDVVFFEWGQTAGGYDHVGIVEAVRSDGLVTIEGNTQDQVMRHFRSWGSGMVEFGRPAYSAAQAPSSPPPANSVGVYRLGSTGDYVKTIQKLVQVAQDGVYGPQTEAAVREWQRKLGIPADGVWGPATTSATENFFQWLANQNRAPGDIAGDGQLMRPGDQNNDVKNLQNYLNTMGQNAGAEDGIYGPATEAAVKRWQVALGVPVDGKWGPEDQKAAWDLGVFLNGLAKQRPTIAMGSTGEDVKYLQSKLGLNVDGIFGPITQRAVIRFQAQRGIGSDGVVGPLTWRLLG